MRVLVMCDDYWHPAETVRKGLAPLAGKGYDFEWLADGKEWDSSRMDSFPLVILSKSNNVSAADRSEWVTPEVETAFLEFVRQGGGLLVIHSGTVGYTQCPTLRAVIGGVFLNHPKQCPVTVTPTA